MKVKSIYAENFQAYNTIHLQDLDKFHTFALLGDNGAGKSSVLEILLYNIFGITMRGKLKNLMNINAKSMNTICEYIIGEETLKIERGMNNTASFLKVFVNGKEKGLKSIENTQNFILNKYFSMSENLFKKSHLFRSNILEEENDKTSKLSISDLVEELFSVKELDKAKEVMTNFRVNLDRSFKRGLNLVNQYTSQVDNLKRIKEDAEVESVSILENKREILTKQKEELEIIKQKYKEINLEYTKRAENLDKDDATLSSLSENKYKISANISSKESIYRENNKIFSLDTCPFCKQPISQEKKKTLKEVMDGVVSEINNMKQDMTTMESKIKALQEVKQKSREEVNSFKDKADKLKVQFQVLKGNITNLEVEISELSNKKPNTTKVDEEISKINSKMKKMIGVMTANSYFYDYADKMVKILSEGSEFRYFFINLDGFNQIIKKYAKFFGLKFGIQLSIDAKSQIIPTITPTYSPTKTLEYSQLSQGQKRKTVLVLLMSIITFLLNDKRHLKMLFFDEVLDNLDVEGVDAMMNYIQHLKEQQDIQVFFISHSHLSKILQNNFFDKIFWAYQSGSGVSNIYELKLDSISDELLTEVLSSEKSLEGVIIESLNRSEKLNLVLGNGLLNKVVVRLI